MEENKAKFSKIYDQYIEKIYRFVFLKVNSQETAEDITADTFTNAWEAFQKGLIENPQPFLYQIARNLITDHYREKGKAQFVSIDCEPIIDPNFNLEASAAINSDLAIVRKALVGLKEDYQNVIIWHYLDDLPICQVAKLMDRSEDATRVLLHRALKSLKNDLKLTKEV
ncbi:MAG: RNA polymerase sigma factor [bacterium]